MISRNAHKLDRLRQMNVNLPSEESQVSSSKLHIKIMGYIFTIFSLIISLQAEIFPNSLNTFMFRSKVQDRRVCTSCKQISHRVGVFVCTCSVCGSLHCIFIPFFIADAIEIVLFDVMCGFMRKHPDVWIMRFVPLQTP